MSGEGDAAARLAKMEGGIAVSSPSCFAI